jgi:hypothetical protein
MSEMGATIGFLETESRDQAVLQAVEAEVPRSLAAAVRLRRGSLENIKPISPISPWSAGWLVLSPVFINDR